MCQHERVDRRKTTIFWAAASIFIIFYLLRIVSGKYLLTDSEDYLYTRDLIKNGGYFLRDTAFGSAYDKTRRPFLYPLFLAVLSFTNVNVVLFAQTLFGILNVWLMMRLYKMLDAKLPWLFIIFILLTPAMMIYSQMVMTEWLVMTLILLLALLLLSGWSDRKFLAIQVITSLLAFAKPVFYPLIILNFVYFAFYLYTVRRFRLALFIPLISLVCYLSFNNYRTGCAHFSSIENNNLLNYNLYYFKSSHESKAAADKWLHNINAHAEKLATFRERYIFLKSKGIEAISNNPVSYSWYHFYTAIRGVFDPGRFDLMTFFETEDGSRGFLEILNSRQPLKTVIKKHMFIYAMLIPVFLAQLLKIFGASAYVYRSRKKINVLNFYLFLVVAYYILITGPVNCSRLMMPFQGIFIVLSCVYYRNKFFIREPASN